MPAAWSSSVLPFGAACLGIALFAAMDATLKAVAIAIGAYSTTLWRAAIGTAIGGLLFLGRRQRNWPGRPALRLHLLRGAVTALMAVLFFWGIARIPLAEAIAISFVAPLIALFLAAAVLGERIRAPAIAGSLLGTMGVGAILLARAHGGFGPEALPGAVAVLASAVLYAVNIVLMRKQALIADPLEVAFFQNLTSLAWLALAAPALAVRPGEAELPALAAGAGLAFLSLFLLSWAYRRAEAQALIAVEYTAFAWAALFGWLVYGERLTWPVLAGTALIVVGCVVASRRQREPVEPRMEAAI